MVTDVASYRQSENIGIVKDQYDLKTVLAHLILLIELILILGERISV